MLQAEVDIVDFAPRPAVSTEGNILAGLQLPAIRRHVPAPVTKFGKQVGSHVKNMLTILAWGRDLRLLRCNVESLGPHLVSYSRIT